MRVCEEASREIAGSTEMINIPSPIPELDEPSRDDNNLVSIAQIQVLYYNFVLSLCSNPKYIVFILLFILSVLLM